MIQWNSLLVTFLLVFMASILCRLLLVRLNIGHLRRYGNQVPEVFKGDIDEAVLHKMTDYTITSSRFGVWESVCDDAISLLVLLSGVLPWFVWVILPWHLHVIFSGLIFFGVLAALGSLCDIPFSLYSTFVIERRFGFSTTSLRLWLTDLLKGWLISAVLMAILLGAFLALMHYAAATWWFWAWLVFASFQMLMLWLYPIWIAPLFNKYEPVKDETLNAAIIDMMGRAGLKIKGVYQVDEGKRTRHTNAYFTGLGRTKRIILYDTLLTSHSQEEILAVLAHEIGHWKRKHILKQLVFIETTSLIGFYLAYRFVGWPLPYQTFGFDQVVPYAGLLLAGFLFSPLFFFFSPLGAMASRKFEREADDFAIAVTGTGEPLIRALKRLAKDNLANLHPHPLYTWFYYSHPPLTERIARLQRTAD